MVDRVDVQRAATAKASASLRDVYEEMLPRVMAPARPQHDARALGDGGQGVRVVGREDTDDVGDGRARDEDGEPPAPNPRPRLCDIDPRVLVSAISAMILGWASIEDWVWPTAGIDPAEKDEVYRQLREIVGYLADLTLVPAVTAHQAE